LEEHKDKLYYSLIGRIISLLNTNIETVSVLDSIIREIGETMEAGVSLVLLDSTRHKLVHTTSWGLPDAYLHKGIVDAEKSLGEAINGKAVLIQDINIDSRVQFPDLAAKAGISSILGIPLIIQDVLVGGLRIYKKDAFKFSEADIELLTLITRLIALCISKGKYLGIENTTRSGKAENKPQQTLLQQIREVVFAHPSEKEFSRLLDFYHIEWIYEPRSFPLIWEDDKVSEMFTPDFYLPALDLYIELTTLKQSLVTKKNRKLRRLRELYPDIKITLLYKKDFDRLLAKYGLGPLVETRSRSVNQVLFSATDIQKQVRKLAGQISKDYADRHPVVIGVLRGVFCFMSDIVREMTIPLDIDFMAISYFHNKDNSEVNISKDIDLNISGRHVILVEDIVDTGLTLSYVMKHLQMKKPASLTVCTLLDKKVRRIADLSLNYIGFEVPDEFLVGYGLDYNEEYRNLPYIGILTSKNDPPV
jgi:hypoxanthine phosphoribosyltransferase